MDLSSAPSATRLGSSAGEGAQQRGVLPPIFLDGEVVSGRFQVRRFLGQGGMGQVFEAFDRELGTEVAIKVVRPDRIDQGDLERRFRAEVEIARRVTHPNVCRVFDLFLVEPTSSPWGDGGEPLLLLTMELVDGETLASLIQRQGSLPLEMARPLIRQIAAALDAAHRSGVAHRDLKPSNIVLRRREGKLEAVLTDFGLARSTGSSGAVLGFEGTLAYAAPEVRRGVEGDTRADIFSLGAVVQDMLTGRLARASDDPTAVAAGLPPMVREVLRKCKETSPSLRYATAGEVVSALFPSRPRPSSRVGLLLGVLLLVSGLWLSVPKVGGPSVEADEASETSERWRAAKLRYEEVTRGRQGEFGYRLRQVEALAAAGDASAALSLVRRMREAAPPTSRQIAELALTEARVAERAGDYERQYRAAAESVAYGDAALDPLGVARARVLEGSALYRLGQTERATEITRQALEELAAGGDLWSRAQASLSFDLWFLAEHELLSVEEALEVFRGVGDRESEARLLAAATRSQINSHPTPIAMMPSVDRALEIAREISSFRAEAEALNTRAILRWSGGDESGGISGFQEALHAAEASGDQRLIASYSMHLGLILQHYGTSTEVLALLEKAVVLFRDLGSRRDLAKALGNVARFHRNRRNFELAEDLAEEALREARSFGDRWLVHQTLELQTTVFLAGGRFEAAKAASREALQLAATDSERDWDRLRLARIQAAEGRYLDAYPAVAAIVERHPLAEGRGALAISSRLDLAVILEQLDRPAEAARTLEEVLPPILSTGSNGKRRRGSHQAGRLHRALAGSTDFPSIFAGTRESAWREGRYDDFALTTLEQAVFLRQLGRGVEACAVVDDAQHRAAGLVHPRLVRRLAESQAVCPA